MSQYEPFHNYFGIDIAGNKDLVTNLNNLMDFAPSSVFDENSCDSDFNFNFRLDVNGFGTFDPLDSIRRDSLDDFRMNGRECDLDELDSYQVELRRQSTKERLAIQQESNPVVLEVLAFKERKRAARKAKQKSICVFCKNNGETASIYTSHVLKDEDGRVTCPILRKYMCPLCGISGDNAHTIRYCPKNEGESAPSLTLRTKRISTGKKRKSSVETD
ncbi:hypothetical protein FSP39_006671 [Pinctada imbricata]|uniref:Nanos-type domain-containing protein n=1 Tax=Pinctada imbricata TaxID=66713 RepID=A0AA88YE29_PINIB|nr:hypothetical protein FSP39_006671 [Pinctada imbricata]